MADKIARAMATLVSPILEAQRELTGKDVEKLERQMEETPEAKSTEELTAQDVENLEKDLDRLMEDTPKQAMEAKSTAEVKPEKDVAKDFSSPPSRKRPAAATPSTPQKRRKGKTPAEL